MVRIQRCRLDVGDRRHTAMLVPAADGFRVLVDPQLWERSTSDTHLRRRLRFVVAHELGHTLFYRRGRPPKRTRPADRSEEGFCHRFAGALLVPPSAAREIPLDPPGLYALSDRYDVSVPVVARAVARVNPGLTILRLTRAPHPTRGGEVTMRVQWGASDRYIAVGESFKSPLAELAPGDFAWSVERLLLSGRTEEVEVAAWRDANAMFAFIRPSAAPVAA
jgi:hypothetical protein